jgi:transcriptional regulator with XRE-family HTH domain
MTQSELAAGAGVGISSVRKIEQGDLGVNLRTLLKLVHFLDHDLNVAPRQPKSRTPATKAASR